MTAYWKLVRKILRVPMRMMELAEAHRMADGCVLAADVRLFPSCNVENWSGNRSAIQVGTKTQVLGELVVLAHGGSIAIGASCFIGQGARIWSASAITIGDRVLISHGVNVHDNNSHSTSAHARHLHVDAILGSGHPAQVDDVPTAPIVIEDDAWIGFNATILKGVRIGRGAIVGTCSMVTKDVPDYTIVAGSPARIIGESRA